MTAMDAAPQEPKARISRSRWKPAPKAQRPRFQLTQDDIDICVFIGRVKVANSDQVARMFAPRSDAHIRRRLEILFHWHYIGRPTAQKPTPAHQKFGRPFMYVLKPKGATLVAEQRGLSLHGYAHEAGLRSLDHETEVAELMLRAARSQSEQRQLAWWDELEPLLPACKASDRQGERFKVKVMWQSKLYTLWLRPDQTFSLVDFNKPAERAARFLRLELDRGTMPLKRNNKKSELQQSSIFRKLLAYSQAYKDEKHKALFGFPNIRHLFVAPSSVRRDNMRTLFRNHKFDLASQRLFLFSDWPTIKAYDNIFDVPWMLADGSTVTLAD